MDHRWRAEGLWPRVQEEADGGEEHREVNAVMYWDGGWVWMVFMPLAWILLAGLVLLAVARLMPGSGSRHDSHDRQQPDRETPEEMLDRRFASGEIDAEAYTKARERLAAHRPPP